MLLSTHKQKWDNNQSWVDLNLGLRKYLHTNYGYFRLEDTVNQISSS